LSSGNQKNATAINRKITTKRKIATGPYSMSSVRKNRFSSSPTGPQNLTRFSRRFEAKASQISLASSWGLPTHSILTNYVSWLPALRPCLMKKNTTSLFSEVFWLLVQISVA
jgi:hypothetical protein